MEKVEIEKKTLEEMIIAIRDLGNQLSAAKSVLWRLRNQTVSSLIDLDSDRTRLTPETCIGLLMNKAAKILEDDRQKG